MTRHEMPAGAGHVTPGSDEVLSRLGRAGVEIVLALVPLVLVGLAALLVLP